MTMRLTTYTTSGTTGYCINTNTSTVTATNGVYIYSGSAQINAMPNSNSSPSTEEISEDDIRWAKKELSSLVFKDLYSRGPGTEQQIRGGVALGSGEREMKLLKIALDYLKANKDIQHKNGTYRIWPKNVCKNCEEEIKERGLFFSSYIGCMC